MEVGKALAAGTMEDCLTVHENGERVEELEDGVARLVDRENDCPALQRQPAKAAR